jgi:hypothetical protein
VAALFRALQFYWPVNQALENQLFSSLLQHKLQQRE